MDNVLYEICVVYISKKGSIKREYVKAKSSVSAIATVMRKGDVGKVLSTAPEVIL